MPMPYISIKDYTYSLPEERIAKYPLKQRDESKLLIFNDKKIFTRSFKHLADYLSPKDLLVFNNTKVIQARLLFQKPEQGSVIEIFCLEPLNPADYNLAFQKRKDCVWKCIVGNLKKWKQGPLSLAPALSGEALPYLEATLEYNHHTWQEIRFSWSSEDTFGDILDKTGNTPIPPYLNRASEPIDKDRYQTVYSKHKGSVAAPTAGLHFTPKTLLDINKKGLSQGNVTLHVGAGTFKPVQTDDVLQHEMHSEYFTVTRSLLEQMIHCQGDIIAVGTTSLRTLESLYWLGVQLFQKNQSTSALDNAGISPSKSFHINQWDPYNNLNDITLKESINLLLQFLDSQQSDTLHATTQIMIVPGYSFKVTDKLITNFHQPQSTLLLLVSAFIGESWKEVYQYALQNDYRFLSYGDSSLLIRNKTYET